MAGPNPFHSAFTPSTAMVFRAQSMIPEYVPVGADCNLDLRTWSTDRSALGLPKTRMMLTSGGMAMDHMATPAVPPARITWPMLRSEDDELAGASAFFVTS
jgi:hypothetical protein